MTDEPQPPLPAEIPPREFLPAWPPAHPLPNPPPEEGSGPFRSAAARRPPGRRLALILFLVTCATTFFAGTMQFPAWFRVLRTVIDPETGNKIVQVVIDPATGRPLLLADWPHTILNGLTYAIAVLVMLGAHEMGHYLQARRYRVPASLPFFIPMPFGPLGTMGAVIFQQPGVANRKSLFDIAISGPLAGLIIALPLNWWGILHSKIIPIEPGSGGYSNPLLVEWMVGWILEPLKPGEDFALNPIAFAGWVGFFITGLNLLPIGQLDGGHLLYCLVGKPAHRIARALYLFAIGFVVFQVLRGHWEYAAWTLMLILIRIMGTQHPPTADDNVPIGKTRIVLGWLTLAFILIGFVPAPMYFNESPAPPPVKPPTVDVDVATSRV